MRILRFAARVASKLYNEFGPEAVDRRVRATAHMVENPMASLVLAVLLIGPELVPPELFGPELWSQLFE